MGRAIQRTQSPGPNVTAQAATTMATTATTTTITTTVRIVVETCGSCSFEMQNLELQNFRALKSTVHVFWNYSSIISQLAAAVAVASAAAGR